MKYLDSFNLYVILSLGLDDDQQAVRVTQEESHSSSPVDIPTWLTA